MLIKIQVQRNCVSSCLSLNIFSVTESSVILKVSKEVRYFYNNEIYSMAIIDIWVGIPVIREIFFLS